MIFEDEAILEQKKAGKPHVLIMCSAPFCKLFAETELNGAVNTKCTF